MPYFSLKHNGDTFGPPLPSSSSAEKTIVSTTPVNVSHPTDLPPPVLQGPPSPGRRGRSKKKARIDHGIKAHWDRFRRRLGTGTAPSTSTALELDESGDGSSYPPFRPDPLAEPEAEDEDEVVDEVVVDREWSDEIKSSSVTHSEHGGIPDKSGGSNLLGTCTDRESFAVHPTGFWALCSPLVLLRWRAWPILMSFFCTRFLDEKSEMHYKKENWFLRKNLALWSSAFLIVNWALGIGFIAKPIVLADQIFYYGVAPALTFPILPMVMYDLPRDNTIFYQIFLVFSTWSWALYSLLFMYLCGNYKQSLSIFTCGNKDFLTMYYYASALQTVGLFGLKLHRLPAMLGALTFFILSCVLIVPIHYTFVRNVINFVAFQAFLLYIHFMRESAERRLYTLRDQLKIQFRATQKAQVNERKASDSKRRLTSYVFHEVRVPLNTALLAVQNMEASMSVAQAQEIEFKALEGSLSMMSKVLNDVLDFNRMDSGRFESVLKPYAFHQVLRSMFVPLRLATDARMLEFVTDLDGNIDAAARNSLQEAVGENDAVLRARLASLEEDGIVVGDENRLRQIITNLASNACKFTPSGGKLTIRTKLILPGYPFGEDTVQTSETSVEKGLQDTKDPRSSDDSGDLTHTLDAKESALHGGSDLLSAKRLVQHNMFNSKPASPLEWIVVRIEVSDTGYGIRPKDMVESKLFSAFNQTEQGRLQGGKGTGLGLALVRQIVKLSGGRLGLRSKVGEGSTFWVELPLGVGYKAIPALIMSPGERDRGLGFDNNRTDSGKTITMSDFPAHNATAGSPASRSSSAFRTIMDQGGLVEMSTRRGESPVLTRTIGDPSTGTHADDFTLGSPIEPPELPSPPAEGSSKSVRLFLPQLPKPHQFKSDEASTSPATSAGSSVPHPALNAASPSGAREGRMRVLVVDDDPLTRKLMSRMLTRIGCRVVTADNGEMALEMILGSAPRATPSSEETGSAALSVEGSAVGEDAQFAVIFLDNQMPVLSGLNAVAKLREMGRHDFVVGVTGNALLTDQREYLEAGADHVLTKPVLEKSLKSMLVIADERRKRRSYSAEEQPDPLTPDVSRSS
ncbi:hypothetical protein SCP_0906260 [Sparassis crispa]|uniref:histidine kinase n=1 Tax=Sparassis crispa TaxID=139825 RepID=A0A401GWY6_9APHY|nr:hypothetical protein SCP_0906260 [Sparassis crispa]GBE86745.1 hypothetical protein SCP_0906260 [Sparassis crispa]